MCILTYIDLSTDTLVYAPMMHSQGRPGHRRSYSSGTFASMGALPHRTRPSSAQKPTFHFDDDDSSDRDDTDRLLGLPPLRLKPTFNAVPFPRTSPLHTPPLTPPLITPPLYSPRTSSPTILLSNGKPLKSSLKSSSSSPNIPFPSQSLVPSIMFPELHKQLHQRASSAPCIPILQPPPQSGPTSSSPPCIHHHVHKNVHFPSQEEGGLATVRLFNRSARPASLGRLGEETDTETEGEASATALYGNDAWTAYTGKYVGGTSFPFPRVATPIEKKSPLSSSVQTRKNPSYDINWSQSSTIPRKNINLATEHVLFHSLQIVPSPDSGKPLFLFS